MGAVDLVGGDDDRALGQRVHAVLGADGDGEPFLAQRLPQQADQHVLLLQPGEDLADSVAFFEFRAVLFVAAGELVSDVLAAYVDLLDVTCFGALDELVNGLIGFATTSAGEYRKDNCDYGDKNEEVDKAVTQPTSGHMLLSLGASQKGASRLTALTVKL